MRTSWSQYRRNECYGWNINTVFSDFHYSRCGRYWKEEDPNRRIHSRTKPSRYSSFLIVNYNETSEFPKSRNNQIMTEGYNIQILHPRTRSASYWRRIPLMLLKPRDPYHGRFFSFMSVGTTWIKIFHVTTNFHSDTLQEDRKNTDEIQPASDKVHHDRQRYFPPSQFRTPNRLICSLTLYWFEFLYEEKVARIRSQYSKWGISLWRSIVYYRDHWYVLYGNSLPSSNFELFGDNNQNSPINYVPRTILRALQRFCYYSQYWYTTTTQKGEKLLIPYVN